MTVSMAALKCIVLFSILALLIIFVKAQGGRQESKLLVEDLADHKEFKKLMRTKNNVLVLYSKTGKDATHLVQLLGKVADEVKGQATLATVDCGGEGRKLCRKLKVQPEPLCLKHYRDGEYHKDYDRKETVQSMVNFLKDPTGDSPWEEDETSKDVFHVVDANSLGKLLHKEKIPVMVMFYVPWCGYCKKLKPDYAAAATDLKGYSILAAMDLTRPENSVVRKHFNISGFPTLLYFKNGNLKYKYDGENNKDEIIKFMKSPSKQPKKVKETEWSATDSDIIHLKDLTFDEFVKSEMSVLVMFYAPWCGHCKKMKPDYVDAAARLKDQNISGMLAAVDATKEKQLGERFKVQGYPTVKYFKDGEFAFDANVRTAESIVEFMKNPKEPPPPPLPEVPWSEMPSDVVHLDEENFQVFLKRKKHVLVMFYAPWCGHCKKAKPEYQSAAAKYREDLKIAFAAIDCTVYSSVCTENGVQGYPTFKYFSYYKTAKAYDGGRTEADFVAFMKNPQTPLQASPSSPPNPEEFWTGVSGAKHLHHLNSKNFNTFLQKEDSVLVMFYADWCGHCKKLKPIYSEVAGTLHSKKIPGKLATVDAVAERDLAKNYNIQGFPTVKYFRKGTFITDYEKKRNVEDFLAFMTMPPSMKDEL